MDIFGNLTDWEQVLDKHNDLKKSETLHEHQAGLIRILRYHNNWKLREVVLEFITYLNEPSDEILTEAINIMMDEGVYLGARILAANALTKLVVKHKDDRENNQSINKTVVIKKMESILDSPPPATFLIIGNGVVGLQAIATAKKLSGVVQAVDIREDACKAAETLGAKMVGFEVPPDLAIGKGGYAKALSEEWLEKEREALAPRVQEADILILSALVPGEIAPVLITEEMVASMRPASVIVDVSIDQGGIMRPLKQDGPSKSMGFWYAEC